MLTKSKSRTEKACVPANPREEPAENVHEADRCARSAKDLLKHAWLDRDVGWLAFNNRVLHEALDERNPLLERLKFLAIVTSNLDEFFMKRVSVLRGKARVEDLEDPVPHEGDARDRLARIRGMVNEMLVGAGALLHRDPAAGARPTRYRPGNLGPPDDCASARKPHATSTPTCRPPSPRSASIRPIRFPSCRTCRPTGPSCCAREDSQEMRVVRVKIPVRDRTVGRPQERRGAARARVRRARGLDPAQRLQALSGHGDRIGDAVPHPAQCRG